MNGMAIITLRGTEVGTTIRSIQTVCDDFRLMSAFQHS
jgi:hypothetical protein